MEQVDLTAEKRTEVGSTAVKQLRETGFIPANLHGINKREAISLSLKVTDFFLATHTKAREHVIFNLQIKSKEALVTETAIAKEIQYDPIKGFIRHIDFASISLKEKIIVPVQVYLVGQAIGVKEGGVLEQLLHEIEIEAFPLDVPEHIEVSVSNLKIGDAFHIRELNLGENIKIKENPEDTIVLVTHQVAQVEEVVTPEAEAAKSIEPEVISKGKEKLEEEKES